MAKKFFVGEHLLCRCFALAPIYAPPECQKALRMGTLATQAKSVDLASLDTKILDAIVSEINSFSLAVENCGG